MESDYTENSDFSNESFTSTSKYSSLNSSEEYLNLSEELSDNVSSSYYSEEFSYSIEEETEDFLKNIEPKNKKSPALEENQPSQNQRSSKEFSVLLLLF